MPIPPAPLDKGVSIPLNSPLIREVSIPPAPLDKGRVDSFKLSTANFESINLTEDSQVYLFLIKIVSHNN
ncbi:NADHX epimerase / NADHX dehydratase [Microcystis panniformis FACHB-1757]|uniref:NADHX epimerase / NADHX dehydratase n=1 Tax=Microcystis panniformis FACHB-1757 TaxID=1638788 RepID=A0A0K1S7S9_9CHRO|nr:NADHX epimerase / NADHX dehydratase [Microcystis panniformis FACHB-1757]